MNRLAFLFAVVSVFAAGPAAFGALPDGVPVVAQPVPGAGTRAKSLKANIDSFQLTLAYQGEQDKPYYALTLQVKQGAVRRLVDLFHPFETISKAQAEKLIDYLTTEGFLEHAVDVMDPLAGARPAPPTPCYTMTLSGEEGADRHQFTEVLGWEMPLLKRLDGLRAVLDDAQAARAMDLLLQRMAGHRKQWQTPVSVPVVERGAEFRTAVQVEWRVPPVGGKSDIVLGLQVTNRTDKPMQINLFETLRPVLKDADGKEMKYQWGRDRTTYHEPLVLKPGQSETIWRDAILEWMDDGKHLRLRGPDDTGGTWWFDGLNKGKYTVSLVFENTEERLRPVLDRLKQVHNSSDAPFWMGAATTHKLFMVIGDPIDCLVSRLSEDRLWQNGVFPFLDLSATAPTEEVVSKVFENISFRHGKVTEHKTLSEREVQIAGSLPDRYIAMIVETNLGEKIVLLQRPENGHSWWSRVFESDRSQIQK